MKFLVFNLAVIGALIYLFSADRNGLSLGGEQGENALQVLRQELESLAQDVADGRRSAEPTVPGSAAAKTPEGAAQRPQTEDINPALEAPKDQPTAAASVAPEAAPVKQSAEPDLAQQDSSQQGLAPASAQLSATPKGEPGENDPVPLTANALPQVDDPAVARRRAEVLDGVAAFDGAPSETNVKAGLPMSPDERLRRLYSLAEEMELLYVRKISR